MDAIREIGSIEIDREQQRHWRTGALAVDWARRYPELFDDDDLRLVQNQGRYGYHLYEWLAAIFLHQFTGYLALVGKYEFPRHRRKDHIVHQVLSLDVIAALRDRSGDANAQAPDLLMYAPDHSDWFFCEVQGPGDRLSQAQRAKFAALAALTRKPVRLLKSRWAPGGARTRAAPTGLTVAAMRTKERPGG